MNRGRRRRRLHGCSNDPDPGGGVRAGGLVRHLPGGYAAQGEGRGRGAERGTLGPAHAGLRAQLRAPLHPSHPAGAGRRAAAASSSPGRGLESPPGRSRPSSPTLRHSRAGHDPLSPLSSPLTGRGRCRSPARAGGARPLRSSNLTAGAKLGPA